MISSELTCESELPMATCTATDQRIDLSEAEALLKLPVPIPVHSVSGIVGPDSTRALARFDARNGIDYDPDAIEDARWNLKESPTPRARSRVAVLPRSGRRRSDGGRRNRRVSLRGRT